MAKILIVESDEGTRYLYKTAIAFQHIETDTAVNIEEAMAKIISGNPDLVLLDIMTPDLKNVDLLKELREKIKGSLPMIILTDIGGENIRKEVSLYGACEYLSKPESSLGDIIKKVRKALE